MSGSPHHIHDLRIITTGKLDGDKRRLQDDFMEHGFAVFNHNGLDRDTRRRLVKWLARFFQQDLQVKCTFERAEGGHQRGYTPPRTEYAVGQTPDTADLKEFLQDGPEDSEAHGFQPNVPTEWPGFDDLRRTVYKEMRAHIDMVLRIIAPIIGVDPDWLVRYASGGDDVLRYLHYYPLRGEQFKTGTLRSAKHLDINLLTALITFARGLVVKSKSGQIIEVDAPEDHLTVQTGMMLAALTADLMAATEHWVINPDDLDASRFSAALFNHPAPKRWVDVLPHLHRDDYHFDGRTERCYTEEQLVRIGVYKGPLHWDHERASRGYPAPPSPWPDHI